MADAHSLLGASGADGWSYCFGKPAMEDGRKRTSEFADEGSAAHDLSAQVLTRRIAGEQVTARDYLGQKLTVKTWDQAAKRQVVRTFTVDEDMAEHVDTYVDRFLVMANSADALHFVEQRLYYHEHLGVEKELAWGTGDGIAILWNQPELQWEDANGKVQVFPAGDELQVHDLKFGKGVMVFADTMQTKLYGSGGLWAWEPVGNFTRVRLVIHQPRKGWFDELIMTPADLLAEVRTLRAAVPKVREAYELAKRARAAGQDDLTVGRTLDAAGFLHPTEKACRFCDAKAVCPALAAVVSEGVSGRVVKPEDFADLTVDTPEAVGDYGGNYLAEAFARLELIEAWSHAVRAEIDRRVLLHGEQIAGCKVVPGRKGPRKYVDQGEAEAWARRQPPAVRQVLFRQKLLTPTQAEAALAKSMPNTWAALDAYIQPGAQGKPAVVPLSDPRAPMAPRAKAEDFEDLTQEQPAANRGAPGHERHPFR